MALSEFCEKSKDFIWNPPENDAFMTILSGAIRSSKTYTMIPKLIFALNGYRVDGDRIFFGVSKDTIYHNVLNSLFDFVGAANYSYNRQNGQLWLYDTEWTVVGAKDEGSEKYVRGRTVGICYGDEIALTPKSFMDMMLSRMSPEGARFYGTTNPDSPYHYIYKDYISNEEKIKSGIVKCINFTLDDNLSLSEATRERYRQLYKGVFKQRFIDGLWVIAEGAVYKDSYSEELQYDDSTRPIGLHGSGGYASMYVAIDYGTTNPTVFLLIIDDGETYWIDREYYWDSKETTLDSEGKQWGGSQKTDKQYAEDLAKFIKDYAPSGAQCVIDPSAASFKAQLIQDGIWHCDAENEVEDGIRTVSSLLAQRKIRIHKRCVKTNTELQTYSWNPKKTLQGEDAVIKQHDHAPDALRYFCETLVPKWRISA